MKQGKLSGSVRFILGEDSFDSEFSYPHDTTCTAMDMAFGNHIWISRIGWDNPDISIFFREGFNFPEALKPRDIYDSFNSFHQCLSNECRIVSVHEQ